MMENSNFIWRGISDHAILQVIGKRLRGIRLDQNLTQAQLAEKAGLNRFTIAQLEKGESTSLNTLIKVIRMLDAFHLLDAFQEQAPVISPVAYAKMQREQRQRASGSGQANEPDLEW